MFSIFKSQSSTSSIDCAILSAMPEELSILNVFFGPHQQSICTVGGFSFPIFEVDGYRILMTPTGIGTTFATLITTMIQMHFKPACMLFVGTAGAIEGGLNICDIILVESAFEAEIQGMFTALLGTPFESCLTQPLSEQKIPSIYPAHPSLLELAETIEQPIKKGTVVTSNVFPAPKDTFPKLRASGALAIDMETAAFYQTAWFLQTPCLAVRAVSNKLDNDGNDNDINLSDIPGSIQVASDYILQLVKALTCQKKPAAQIEQQASYSL